MTYKIPSPEGIKRLRASASYISYCLSVHVLTSIYIYIYKYYYYNISIIIIMID